MGDFKIGDLAILDTSSAHYAEHIRLYGNWPEMFNVQPHQIYEVKQIMQRDRKHYGEEKMLVFTNGKNYVAEGMNPIPKECLELHKLLYGK